MTLAVKKDVDSNFNDFKSKLSSLVIVCIIIKEIIENHHGPCDIFKSK